MTMAMTGMQLPCLHQYCPNLLITNRRPECDIPQTRKDFLCQDIRYSVPVEMKKGRVLVPLYAEMDGFDARRGHLHECPLYSARREPFFHFRITRLEPEVAEIEGPQVRQTSQVDYAKVPEKERSKIRLHWKR